MPFWAKIRLFEPTPTIARLLLSGLSAFTVWIGDYTLSQPLVALAAGYFGWTVLLFAAPLFQQPPWLVYLSTVVDVAVSTTFIVMIGGGTFPLWTLYLFPIGAATAAGRGPALVAIGTALASCGVVSGITSGNQDATAIWPFALLISAATLIVFLPSRWLADLRERRMCEQITLERESTRRERVLAHAAVQMLSTFEPERVSETVLHAATDGLKAQATLVNRAAIDGLAEEEQVESPPTPTTALDVPITSTLRLSVPQPAVGVRQEHQQWLQRLARLAGGTLTRCAEYCDLQREEQHLRTLWENLPAPAALWTANGALLLANGAYRELHPPMQASDDEHSEELAIGDPPRIFVVMRGKLPQSSCQLEVLREITRERQELTAKDEFLSLVGHELRTPLTSIHGFSQLIDRNLSVIKQQVGQLDRLINDLATESSGQGGKLSLDLQPVDVAELVKGVAERFEANYSDRNLELQIEAVAPVQADPTRLIQVIDNLLNNAVKYSPTDGGIALRVGMRDGDVVLDVQDQGVGIASEHLPHLFERFYRVPDEETERVKGLGLGLSIVRDLVLAHGGRVWAESEGRGHGSTFRLSFPVAIPQAAGELLHNETG
jgi:signal transduction histidine kinase